MPLRAAAAAPATPPAEAAAGWGRVGPGAGSLGHGKLAPLGHGKLAGGFSESLASCSVTVVAAGVIMMILWGSDSGRDLRVRVSVSS